MTARRVTLKPTDTLDEVRGKLAAASGHVTFRVYGTPAPQGSKRGFVNRSGGVSMVESSAKVKPWRQDVKYAALEARPVTVDGMPPFAKGTPVRIDLTFWLVRPAGHYGSGKNAGTVKASSPWRPGTKPDLDKLVRSTMDALGEAGIWADDSQVVTVVAAKWYADHRPPGADIEVRAA